MDSYIRLRQINQPELSGYVSQVIPQVLVANGLTLSGSSLVPSGSGIYDLGETGRYFDTLYINDVTIPSGSGIHFGPNLFSAFYSGDYVVFSLGGRVVSSDPQGLSIIGPSGLQGLAGPSGATGVSGIGISGVVKSGNYMNVFFTNSGFDSIELVSGATGATGVSLTGLLQSGSSWLYPLFSNNTTGTAFQVSGARGPQGVAGGIFIDLNQFTGVTTGQRYPAVTIYNVDPNGTLNNPTLNFVKGMRYTIGVSGINTMTGLWEGRPYTGNAFVDENGGTGYLKFCFWGASSILDPTYTAKTGRLVTSETAAATAEYIQGIQKDNESWFDIVEDDYKTSISFNIKWSAATGYLYGFARYNVDGTFNEDVPGAYILGSAAVNYYGPTGPSGAQGIQGIPGPEGARGPAGQSSPGVGIADVEQEVYQIRFHYTDNTYSDWIDLPAGGPRGYAGEAGPAGPSGADGPQGAIGPQGDRYSSSFYVYNMFPIGISNYGMKVQSGGFGDWVTMTGANIYCNTGDRIWFSSSSLVGFSYTPWQSVIFSDPVYTAGRSFYANILSYNTNNGEIQAVVTGTPALPSTSPINFADWTNGVLINLGGLGSSGAMGISGMSGAQGPKGDKGDTGRILGNIAPTTGLIRGINNLNCALYDIFDANLSGLGNVINLTGSSIGQTVMLRIKNTGIYAPDDVDPVDDTPMMIWDSAIRWPGVVSAPGPRCNKEGAVPKLTECYANVYTFVRINGSTEYENEDYFMGTYATDYLLQYDRTTPA